MSKPDCEYYSQHHNHELLVITPDGVHSFKEPAQALRFQNNYPKGHTFVRLGHRAPLEFRLKLTREDVKSAQQEEKK